MLGASTAPPHDAAGHDRLNLGRAKRELEYDIAAQRRLDSLEMNRQTLRPCNEMTEIDSRKHVRQLLLATTDRGIKKCAKQSFL